jgi:hypothetical protein
VASGRLRPVYQRLTLPGQLALRPTKTRSADHLGRRANQAGALTDEQWLLGHKANLGGGLKGSASKGGRQPFFFLPPAATGVG